MTNDTNATTPPSTPWVHGNSADYTVFNLEVQVCETHAGGVRSVYTVHGFQTDADEALARSLVSGGEEQIAWSLLINAVRRETFLEVLIALQQDPDFLATYRDADEEKQRNLDVEIAAKVSTMLSKTIQKIAPETAREIMAMLNNG